MEGGGRGPSRGTCSSPGPDDCHHATSPSDRPLGPHVASKGMEVLSSFLGSPRSSHGNPDCIFAHPGTPKRRSVRKWEPFGKC